MTGTLRPEMLINCMRPFDTLMQRQATTQAPGPGASPLPLLYSHFDRAPPSSHALSSSADHAAIFFFPLLSLFILRLVAERFKAVYKVANIRAK